MSALEIYMAIYAFFIFAALHVRRIDKEYIGDRIRFALERRAYSRRNKFNRWLADIIDRIIGE